nr:EOG090X0HIV [Eulimnadia texana]
MQRVQWMQRNFLQLFACVIDCIKVSPARHVSGLNRLALAQGWRQGLFFHCVDESAERPLPFGLQDEVGCYRARDESYIRATAGLCILALATDVFATLLTGLGLQSGDPNRKYKYYRLAVYIMLASLVAALVALVLYPVCFSRELAQGNRPVWEFGWAYGVAWGAAIFLFGSSVLLMCDKEAEEVYYKERDVHHIPRKPRPVFDSTTSQCSRFAFR